MSLKPPYTPMPVTDIQVAFPADVSDLMPEYEEIPEDFRRECGDARPWIAFQRQWFFSGLRGVEIVAKPGVDKGLALRHLKVIQGSFEPQHEHKEAAVAFLASLWLEQVELPAAGAR
jgi:hypothetical protein